MRAFSLARGTFHPRPVPETPVSRGCTNGDSTGRISIVSLRFTPLPNYAASFGAGVDVTTRLYAAVMGNYDDGGVNEQVVNDDIAVTRFENFMKVNASANYKVTERVSLTLRIENLFNARDLGYSRSVLGADGSSQRITGTQRDPGTIVGGGLQVRF